MRRTPAALPGRRRIFRYAIASLVPLAAVVTLVILLNTQALQSDNSVGAGQDVSSKPDINLTARKGLPFPALTPGERLLTPQEEVPISIELQQAVFTAYGLDAEASRQYVVIRLIPAGLGGTVSLRNLFPTTPWFAGLKARLDKRLTELVNSGQLSAEQAEAELTENWVIASHRYYIRNYGIRDPHEARRKEDEIKWE